MPERDEHGRFEKREENTSNTEEKVYAVGYKGFEPGLICRGKHYKENTVFEEPKAEICECGMHFCEDPLDVFQYYAPSQNGKLAEFAKVEALAPATKSDNKSCTTKLRIGAKLTLDELIKAAVDLRFKLAKWTKRKSATGDQGAASATGVRGAASATGWMGAASATGNQGAASATGDQGAASATGWMGAASATGKESFAVSTGCCGKVKAALGCFIACAEWEEKENGEWHPVAFISGKIDGKKLKADVWYTVKNGKFVEVEE